MYSPAYIMVYYVPVSEKQFVKADGLYKNIRINTLIPKVLIP